MGADVVFRRSYDAMENKYAFAWATSEECTPKKNLRRCVLIFSGFSIKPTGPQSCVIAATSCFYEVGNVPAVAITEECKRVALRICKIVKRVGLFILFMISSKP